jgi:class 3 adenylate cyclase
VLDRGSVQYARSGDLRIAYQQFGEGELDLLISPGFISNLDLAWEMPPFRMIFDRLGSFARCLVFDKRGTGLSDRDLGFGSLEERMDDLRAVLDDAGIEQAALFGYSEGGPLSLLFAASYPERVSALALYGSMARVLEAPDYTVGLPADLMPWFIDRVERLWGAGEVLRFFVQHAPDDAATQDLIARYERSAASPKMAARILRHNIEIDIRGILPAIRVPTLVMQTAGDPAIPEPLGQYLANHVPRAAYIERPGGFHMTWDATRAWFLDEVEAFLTGHRPAPVASERMLTTVLFTDIVGSTEQAARLGDRAWRRVLDDHDAQAGLAVQRHGGRVVKTTGDGLLAVLDSPSRAVACALAIRDGVGPLGLRIRAGVHTGEVERRGDDVGGIGVHIGARIAALAGVGEVWVSRTVRDLTAGSGLAFADRGRHPLKGVPGEWELYALAAA